MKSPYLLVIAVTVLFSLLAASPAFAQTDDEKKASEYFQKGAEWYTQGEYPKAIVEFLKGYNTVPNAMFLYNISLSYAKLGNYADALAAAQKARTEEGMGTKVELRNEAHIGGYSVVLSAQNTAKGLAAVAEGGPKDSLPDQEAKASSGGSFGTLGWVGVVVTVVGAGLGVGSVIVASGVQDNIEAYEEAGASGDREAYDRLASDIESGQTTGQFLMYSGIGLGVAGITMIAIEAFGGDSESQALWAAPTSGGLAAGYRLQF